MGRQTSKMYKTRHYSTSSRDEFVIDAKSKQKRFGINDDKNDLCSSESIEMTESVNNQSSDDESNGNIKGSKHDETMSSLLASSESETSVSDNDGNDDETSGDDNDANKKYQNDGGDESTLGVMVSLKKKESVSLCV